MPFGIFKRRGIADRGEQEIMALYDSVPVVLLTGFLGSGKTTLLNELLADPAMTDSAVIVNEFGSVPIDHALVKVGSERYFRTTTGCICCTATSDVRASLFELHEARRLGEIAPFSRVLIETTGLADPAPIINSLVAGGAPAIGLRDHVVGRHFHLSKVFTTLDALDGREMLDRHVEGWKQLAFADHVVATKTDLAGPAFSDLQWLNPAARFHDRHDPDFRPAEIILEAGRYSTLGKTDDVVGWLAMEGLSRHRVHDHDPNRHGDGIKAVALTQEQPLDPYKLQMFLDLIVSNIQSGLLRLKGIVALADDPSRPAIVHAVQHRLYPIQRLDAWPGEPRATKLVLIGHELRSQQIQELFAYLVSTSKARKRRVI
ncbi:G3E family GTPase [Rhizobium sp. BK538]|nr:G3E family GTPase [Rhizobium sp. BK538]